MAEPVDQHVNGNEEDGEDGKPVAVDQGAHAAGDAQPPATKAAPAFALAHPLAYTPVQAPAPMPAQPALNAPEPTVITGIPQDVFYRREEPITHSWLVSYIHKQSVIGNHTEHA